MDDPRTLNKILYIRPPANIYSFNDLVSLWEKKISTTIERIYVPEEQLLKTIQGSSSFFYLDIYLIKFIDEYELLEHHFGVSRIKGLC